YHDSDVNDPIPEDGFNTLDVQVLTKQIVDLRPVPSGLLFQGGLATTWDFPSFCSTFKDTEGNEESKGCYQEKGEKREGGDGGEGSHPKTKRKKIVVLKDNLAASASEATSSLRPLRTFDPNQTNPFDAAATTVESQEDRSTLASPRGSAAHSVNYSDAHRVDEETDTLRLGTSGGQSGKVLTNADTEVARPSPVHHSAHHSNVDEGELSRGRALYVPDWSIHRRCRLDTPAWCRELLVHMAPLAAQEESNALNNATELDRAWFSLACGALAQTDILERFEHLQTDFDRLAEEHAGCEDTVRQLVSARELSQQNSRLYLDISERFRKFKNDHANCPDRIRLLEDQNNELSQTNNEQSLRIKELEDLLAKKDYALVYAERINAERAQEKEKLVTQLGKTEMEKFDSIRKLLPTVVERLLQSHEYKKSLSEPFNLAIQAGWGKGLAEERSEEDLLELMGRMEGFDVYADKKMNVEYNKLFEKRYPYVEKISHGFRHSVSDLLKVYPDSPPSGQAPLNEPLSGEALSTSAPRGS
ncbi:hypothetical protein Tco_1075584, partial [Tanacetum coccineum]